MRPPIAALALLLLPGTRPDALPPSEPTAAYEARRVEGWPVLISPRLRDDPALAAEVLKRLAAQLDQVARVVPAGPLAELRRVTIWLEVAEPHHPCIVYHPDTRWLADRAMNPAKARGVEVSNARNFLDWTKSQPWMVLHELAHAYHHQFLTDGFDNAEVKAAYEASMAAGRYDKVLGGDGDERRAYAATDPMEYFAEASEAFFGTNDFYPFVRAELRRHDQAMDRLLSKCWKVDPR